MWDSSPFGWHDTDGDSGPEFTITRGNNAHAYLDQDNNNQPDFGQDVDGGPGLSFDFDADLTEHAQDYRSAVVSNLFYTNNVIHDPGRQSGVDILRPQSLAVLATDQLHDAAAAAWEDGAHVQLDAESVPVHVGDRRKLGGNLPSAHRHLE